MGRSVHDQFASNYSMTQFQPIPSLPLATSVAQTISQSIAQAIPQVIPNTIATYEIRDSNKYPPY